MGVFESIADRRIKEGRAAGLFDNLPGAGKPIPDLDTERPPGWWAARVVKTERDKMRFDDLARDIRAAMPPIWRMRNELEVRQRVEQLNERISAYNSRTSFVVLEPLDVESTVLRWSRVSR